jgi:hypothetical protein
MPFNISLTKGKLTTDTPFETVYSDYINGYVSSLGREFGIPTPVNDSLVEMVKLKVQLGRDRMIGGS